MNRFQRPRVARLGLELLHDRRVEVRVARLLDLLRRDRRGRVDVELDELGELRLELLRRRGLGAKSMVILVISEPASTDVVYNPAADAGWR